MSPSQQPIYAGIKEMIIKSIEVGTYKPGDQLPTHHELCSLYKASYMTIRRAISELTAEGVLSAVHGKGIYIAEPKEIAETSAFSSFTNDMSSRGLLSSSKVLDAKIVSASTVMAQVLGVKVNEPLIFLRRLRLANNLPLAIQSVFLPTKLCPDLLTHNWEEASLYQILSEKYNLKISASEGTVGAELTSEEDANLLQINIPSALLVTERISRISDGTPIEFTRSLYRADRYQLSIRE